MLWIANDARWFGTIADAVETVPQETTVSGPARVIDGQRVSVAGTRIYLRGLDVAETGTQWGDMAKWGMEMIAGAELRCRLTGDKFDDPRIPRLGDRLLHQTPTAPTSPRSWSAAAWRWPAHASTTAMCGSRRTRKPSD